MRSVNNFLLIIFLSLLTEYVSPQSSFVQNHFRSPLDITLYLSGNFGELRADHFHSGIDIKTQGVRGKKVYATADGYISRIKIEAAGYGKTLYLTHPGGYTTVYAHLDHFIPDIEKFVKEKQYQEKKHALNIFPSKNEFYYKKGEVIAYSGNSGYSFGPHLHFEIREANSQHPMNVLLFGLDIDDNLPPRIFSVCFYPLDEQSFINYSNEKQIIPVKEVNGSYQLTSDQMIKLNGRIGFGIEAYDYLNGSRNRCGLYSTELFVDSIKYFSMKMNKFSFNDSRYVNSMIDYEEKQKNNKNIQKAFIDPNNQLSIYNASVNSGVAEFYDDDIHTITFILKDVYLNSAQLVFQVQGQSQNLVSNRKVNDDFLQLMSWETINIFERDDIRLIIPEKALYKNLKFTYSESDIPEGFYSMIHHIHNIYTPLHIPADLYLKPVGLPDSLQEKAVVVTVNRDGKWQYSGGEWADGFVKTRILQFGEYSITVDTIPPQITPVNLNETLDMKDKTSLRFLIEDDLSGIQSYEGYIDNEWVLFEYDAKNNTVFYIFDPERITREQNHELELYIVDNKDNISFYYCEFYW
jgi:murein DD-endopeptidase MepM/ murein hydrolase activator NlpD